MGLTNIKGRKKFHEGDNLCAELQNLVGFPWEKGMNKG